jgi:outer membrane protein assembly factor BamD
MLFRFMMKSRSFRFLAYLPALVVLVGISGCNSWIARYYFGDEFDKPASETEKAPAQLALDGTEKMRDKDYDEALKDFQQLKERYPYSKYAILAELKVGDAYYYKKDYTEAAVAYEEFVRLHPRNEVAPYVLYQIGMCHFLLFRSVDRDPEETRLAMDSFNRLVQAYPDSQYSSKAKKQLFECQKRIVAHEVAIARFYSRRGEYNSAKQRLDKVMTDYPAAVKDLQCEKEVEEMQTLCASEINKGEKKDSVWTRIGF